MHFQPQTNQEVVKQLLERMHEAFCLTCNAEFHSEIFRSCKIKMDTFLNSMSLQNGKPKFSIFYLGCQIKLLLFSV